MAMDQNYNQFAVSDLLKSPGDVLKQSIPEATPYQLPISSPGNITFPSGYGVKQTESPIASAMEKFYNSTPSERFQATPIKYNATDINAARYMSSPDYYKLGISLYGDNEERYGQNQSWGEVLSNGITGMGKLAYNGFVDGWKGWSRMTDALVHWDWNKLHGDAESMMELDNSLKDIMNLNPIYATKEGSDTFWNRQTFGNFLQQSGFAVGAAAQMFSEQIITKAIEAGLAVTGVGAGAAAELEAVEDVKTAANVGRVARFFQKTKEFYDAAKNFKALKKLGDVWKNEAILKNFVVGFGEKIPGIDIAMDMSKTYEIGKLAGLSGTKIASDIARVGVGGLKRTMSEANFAFTEARMEAAGTFSDLYSQMQQQYYTDHGVYATGSELQFMQNTAMRAADKNFNFNSAVLAVSNRIMFDNIFKNSKAISKILSQFGEDVGEKGLKVLGEIEGRTTTQYYTGGILSNYKQIAADFGASKARKVLARSIMKPLLKFETTEGIQELLQEGSNEYFKDYYLDAYNSKFNPDIKASAEKSFGKAVESQLNMQGLKTFASGALTGMLLHGPTVLIKKGVGKIKEKTEDVYKTQGYTKEQKEEYYKQKKESKDELKNYYNEFNAIAKDPSKLFSESIKNFNIQKEGSSALDEAAKLGDKFAYENIRTDMLHSMVSQAVRNDTHEGLIDTIREYGKNMSKEEFEQAFVGINYSSETKKSAQDYTDKVANAIESYAKTYNKLQDKYGSIANPNRYIRGSEQYMKELFKKKTLNDMIDIMAGNEFKAADALDRSSRIFSTLSGHKTLGSSLASAFNILGSDDALQGELNTLELEISTKKEQLQAEGISKQQKEQLKKEIALKEKQHKNITKWSENKLNITNKSKIAKAQSSFKTYLQLKNEEFGKPTLINDSEVDDMFYAFNDYIKLNKKAQDHVNAINMLSNPDYFDQVYMRMVQGQQMAYLQNLTNAAIDYIKSDKYKADEHFIVQANGKYGIFTSTGMLVKMTDNLEEARKIKEELDKTPKYTEDEISELFKDLEVKPKEPTEETSKESTEKSIKEPEVKPEEKPKTEIKKEQPKVFVNGKSIIFTTQEVKDGKPIFSYYFEDDASKEIQQFTKENDKFIDLETGEEITVTKETPKETVKEPTEKSIDEKIDEIQAKIDALPNKGMVMEGEMITTSKEFKDLTKQIEDLKKQKETPTPQETETTTSTSNIEVKKADIEKRRKENLEDTGDIFDYVSSQPRNDGKFNAFYTKTKESQIFDTYKEAVDWINSKYDAELARELYKEMKAGKLVTDMTPAEQQVADKYITEELRKSVDAELDNLEDEKENIIEETEQTGVEDIDQTFDDKKDKIDGDSKEFEKIFQDGIKQTAPALSVANRTHAVNVVEISPGVERFERGGVNQTYEFEMATPTFMPGQSIIFKVDEFDGKDYDNANIGIYSVLNGKETRIGAIHTPQWISEQKGSNNAYTHIVIPDSEKYDKLPKTLENELATNRKLRKVILDSYKLDSNFVLNGTVNDKSNGIIATMNETGLLKDRINPEIGKGGVENRHGMFGIVRNGYIELSRGQKISEDKLAQTKSFSSSEIANYEGYSVLLIPTPNGTFFPTFMKLPTVAREQSEFILKAWKVFTGRESGDDLINAVYNATGNTYVEGSKPNIEILKSYISHYITDLNSDSLSQIGNGNDAPDNISRLDIFQDGNIKIQGKKNGKWMSVTIRKEQDIPSDILEYMDGLLTSVRFTNIKNDNLLGINNEDKFTLFGVKDGKLTSNNIIYNQYIMNGAKTYLDKGIESKNEYKDWVYFANPVVKFQYSEPLKDLFKDVVENKKPEVTLTEVTDETKKDKASSLLAALKANRLNNQQVKDQENNCSGN